LFPIFPIILIGYRQGKSIFAATWSTESELEDTDFLCLPAKKVTEEESKPIYKSLQ